MTTRIFLFVGHPRETSLSHGLADAYARGAETQGSDIRRMNARDMRFDMDDFGGYSRKHTLEPDLVAWQEAIIWANHVAFFYPYWWAGMPGKMKSVLDRALLPGFAFKYHDKGLMWDKLLDGRTGDAIITSDTPPIYDALRFRKPGRRVIRNQVYGFVGIKPAKILQIGPVKTASEDKIKFWLETAYKMGSEAGRR